MTATKTKSSFLSLVLGGLVMTTISATHALNNPIDWAKCKYCNARSKKCATDDKFFEDCMTKCPESSKSDPLKKCRDAHFGAMKANPAQPKVALNDLVSGTCEQKQGLIKMHNAVAAQHGKAPYSKTETDYILSGCDDKKGGSGSSAAPADVPIPTDLPPEIPTNLRESQKAKPLPTLPQSRRGSLAQGGVPNPQANPDTTSEPSQMQKDLQAQKNRLRRSGSPHAVDSSPEDSPYQPMPAPRSTGTMSPSSSVSKIPLPPQGGPKKTPSVAPVQPSVSAPSDRAGLLGDLNTDNPLARLKKIDPNAPKPEPKTTPSVAPVQSSVGAPSDRAGLLGDLNTDNPMARLKKVDPNAPRPTPKAKPGTATQAKPEAAPSQNLTEILKKAMDERRGSMEVKKLTPEEQAAKDAEDKDWE